MIRVTFELPDDVSLDDQTFDGWRQRFRLEEEVPSDSGSKLRYVRRGRGLNRAISLYTHGIRDGHARDAMDRYTGARYTQHSTGVPDGQAGFIAFFEDFLARNPTRDIRIVRALEDGKHLFVHAYQNLNDGGAEWVTADFFELDEDDRIVEHWDVIAAFAPETPSGHTSIDGATEVRDRDRTDENKAVVRTLIQDVLTEGGDVTRVSSLIAEEYTQHGQVPDGRAAFEAMLAAPDRRLFYDEIVLLVGEGNFVATLCRARHNGEALAQADVFRLEDGKIVEHWDASEPVPPPEELVNSGKF